MPTVISQGYAAARPNDRSIPSLQAVSEAFGMPTAKKFLEDLIRDTAIFCEARTPFSADQISSIADAFLCNPKAMLFKIREWYFFFHMLRSGELVQIYGNITPRVFTDALNVFFDKRADIRCVLMVEEANRKEEAELAEHAKSAVRWDDFKDTPQGQQCAELHKPENKAFTQIINNPYI